MDIANEVASIQNELEILRGKNKALEGELSVVKAERDALRIEYTIVRADRDKHMVRAGRVYTILQQAGLAITGGINAMQEDTRREQETALGVGSAQTSRFIRREVTKGIMTHREMERRHEAYASTRDSEAGDKSDPRLPNVDYAPPSEGDAPQLLRELAGRMGLNDDDQGGGRD